MKIDNFSNLCLLNMERPNLTLNGIKVQLTDAVNRLDCTKWCLLSRLDCIQSRPGPAFPSHIDMCYGVTGCGSGAESSLRRHQELSWGRFQDVSSQI